MYCTVPFLRSPPKNGGCCLNVTDMLGKCKLHFQRFLKSHVGQSPKYWTNMDVPRLYSNLISILMYLVI